MKPGKLPPHLLADLLAGLPSGDPRVIVGPRVGEDAAAITFGDRLLIAKTDPITFATDLLGWYAVHVNANDIACLGGEPRWFLGSLLLPETIEDDEIREIFAQLARACEDLGITPVGGHTEITVGLNRPVILGCMLGEAPPEGLLPKTGARPGDVLFLSGGIAIEGTALLAREIGFRLLRRGVPEAVVARAKDLLFDPGISVVAAARRARDLGGVTALHDPTEGGLATGLAELALAAGAGLEVGEVPVLPETQAVCDALRLDPLGLLASGALLITVRPDTADAFTSGWRSRGAFPLTRLGRLLPPGDGTWLLAPDGSRRPLPTFPRDELARFLAP